MRKVWTLAILAILYASILAGDSGPGPMTVVGTQRITPSTSTALTVPGNTVTAIITVRTAGVHINLESTTATTSDPYFPTGVYEWINQRALLKEMRFITSSDGTAVVDVIYLGAR